MSAASTPMVELRNVRKMYGDTAAIEDLSLAVASGEFLTLLGPSGSGKTTCLRIIAGMIQPDRGHLNIAGRDVSTVPMHKRNVGMVFQNYSLFPHLTAAQNVAYPLRLRGVPVDEVRRKVGATLDMIRLSTVGSRRPDQLSGGQQQRVALARALAYDPDVLLLDEPLSALDRILREEMQLELRRIHRETGKTMIAVTHDRSEALTMSDRIVVMRAGRIVQDAAPRALYQQSNSRFVAEFLGEVNVIPMTLRRSEGRTEVTDVCGRRIVFDDLHDVPSGTVECVVRVENVLLQRSVDAAQSPWRGIVTEAMFLGDVVRLTVRCDPHMIMARVPLRDAQDVSVGSNVALNLADASPMVFAPT